MTQLNAAKIQPARGPATLERRVHVRYSCDLETSCHPLSSSSGQQWAGQVQDLSRGGVALVLDRRFELRTLLVIELQGRPGQPARTVFGRVVHVHRRDDGSWLMGCAFANELSDEDVA